MIYVLTVHHRNDRWVDVQLDALARHMSEPYRVHAVLDGVESDRFDRVIDVQSTKHAPRLDALAADTAAMAEPDDILLFLDGDAFPIADPSPLIDSAFAAGAMLVAVRRDEGSNGGWPHPSFCAVRVRDWLALPGTWAVAKVTDDPKVLHKADVGGELLLRLRRKRVAWHPLLRSNRVNPHPLFFAVYGEIVYHHGAGFRVPMSAGDGRATVGDPDGRAIRRARNQRASDEWWQAARDDPEFWRRLL